MDLYRIIGELAEERNRLDRIIQSLEGVVRTESVSVRPASRRGRKSMDGPARKEVSERMKRYWARQREERAAAKHEARSPKSNGMSVATASVEAALHQAFGA